MTNEETNNEIIALKELLHQKRDELAAIISESEIELQKKIREFDITLYKVKNDFYKKKTELREVIRESKNELDELNSFIKKSRQLLTKSDVRSPLNIAIQQSREKIQEEFVNKSVDLAKILETENYRVGSYNLNSNSRMLVKGSSSVKLTKKEMYLLATLAANINLLIPRKYLLDTIWYDNSYFAGRSMDVFLCKLRVHLQEDERINIVNVHGIGYKLLVNELNLLLSVEHSFLS